MDFLISRAVKIENKKFEKNFFIQLNHVMPNADRDGKASGYFIFVLPFKKK